MPEIRRVIDELKEMKGTSPWTRSVIVDIGGKGDFTSIKAACDYVATQIRSAGEQWFIFVLTGRYAEISFTIPSYTTIHGIGDLAHNTHTYQCCILTSNINSGNYITMETFSFISNIHLRITGTLTGDLTIFYCPNATNAISFCHINFTQSAATYNLRGIYKTGSGNLIVSNSAIYPQTNGNLVCVENAGTGTLGINYCVFVPATGNGVGIKNSGSGSTFITHCRLAQVTGTSFGTYDIQQTAGNLVINNTPYNKSSGTITHADRFYPSTAAIREAVAATDTPLILKGAAAQSANLTEWKDSGNNVLLNIHPNGDLEFHANNIVTDTTTGTKIGTAATQKLGFYGATPVVQQAKADHNNWAALSDVVQALVDLGLFDAV